jgi:hypothetical protein
MFSSYCNERYAENAVSMRVVNASKLRSVSAMSILKRTPSERPIQLRCIVKYTFRPAFHVVKTFDKFISVVGYANEPLVEPAFCYRMCRTSSTLRHR